MDAARRCSSLLYIGLHHAQQFVALPLGAAADERAAWISLDCCGTTVATEYGGSVASGYLMCRLLTSSEHGFICVGRGPRALGVDVPIVYSCRAARMRHSPRARGTVDLSARMYKVTHRISPSHCSPTTSTLAPYKRVFQPSQCPNQLGGPRPWLRAPAPTIDHACGADALGKGGLLSVARKSFRPR